jgi:hypothetical protein
MFQLNTQLVIPGLRIRIQHYSIYCKDILALKVHSKTEARFFFNFDSKRWAYKTYIVLKDFQMLLFIAVLRSRVIFMRLRLRVKILMQLRLRLLPYYIARKKFLNELKFKLMFKLSCSYDSVRFLLLKI